MAYMSSLNEITNGASAHCVNTRSATIVIPCFNESKRLDRAAFESFLQAEPNITFVFVDDGSTDATLDLLLELKRANPDRVCVFGLSRNSGKAEAVRRGLIHATSMGAEFVGYWDADLATPLDAIVDFHRIGRRFTDVNVIFGSRRQMLGHRIERTLKRRFVSGICSFLARRAIRMPIGDTQCGAKLLRNTEVLRSAIMQPFEAGWLFDVELLARVSAKTTNPRTAFFEYPLAHWDEVPGSKVSAKAIVLSGFKMLRLIGMTRFGLRLSPSSMADLAECVEQTSLLEDTLRKSPVALHS